MLALIASLLFLNASFSPSDVKAATSVFINEIHYDNASIDTGEAIEIAGPAGTDLTGWSIVLYNGANGASYNTRALSGTIPNQQNGFGAVNFTYPTDGIQNGSPDGIALINPSNVVVQFLSYEGSFTAVNGPASGMTSTDIGVSEASTTPVGQSLRLSGSGTVYEDFTWNAPDANTFGNVNTGQSFSAPCTVSVFVNEIHYDNASIDTGEAIEIAGPAGTDLTGWSIVLYNGANGASYNTRALSGTIPNQQNGFGAVNFTYPTDGIQNGSPDGIALINPSNVVVQFLSYEGSFTAVNGPASGMTSTDIGVSEASTTPVGQSLRLSGTGCCYDDFTWNAPAASTFGNINTGQTFSCGGGNALTITDVTVVEGNGGATVASFVVNLTSPAGAGGVTFNIATADGSATVADNDYVAKSLPAQTIPQGSQSYIFDVTVNGDTFVEPDEDFFVNVTSVVGATILDGQGKGTITNDDVLITPISAIQGDGLASPLAGQVVSTTGTVTALKSNGFFIQTPDGAQDSDPNTSEGVFVFTSSAPTVARGDAVTVTGTVVEFFSLTEIGNSPVVIVNSSANPLPAPVTLTTTILDPNGPLTQLERFEGMRLTAGSLVSVAPTNQFGEIFTVLEGVARPFREPGIEATIPPPPGAPAGVPIFDKNPERIMVDTDGQLGSARINVTSGVTLTNVVGPLDFNFEEYKIVPDPTPVASPDISAMAVPAPNAGEFTVGSFNMLRFYDTANDPATSDDVLSAAVFQTRLSKASLAIRNMMRSPDILGVQEVENLSTLQAVANKINADAVAAGQPNPNYQAYLIEGNDIGGIDVGFLVKESRVTVDSVTQEGDNETYINPLNNSPELLNDRPPLVLKARVQSPTGSKFPVTVIVNHLRSLNGVDDDTTADGDPIEGPRVRAKRNAQAEYLAGLIQGLQGDNLVVIGDFNSFQFNDGYVDLIGTIKGMPTPADEVVEPGQSPVNPALRVLIDELAPDQRYSFIFEGNPQAIDHVLVDEEMYSLFSRFAYARSNADFPDTSAYSDDATRPERLSDHDMPVAYFNFPPPVADLSIVKTGPSTVVTGSLIEYSITVTNNGQDNAENVIVTDMVPLNTTFNSSSAPGGWTSAVPPAGGTGSISFSTPSLAIGASATFTVKVDVNCATLDGIGISNTASVSSSTADPNASNNSSTVTVTSSNPAPVISGASVDKPVLSPPNHKMVDVVVSYTTSDNCGAVACTLSVTSNEPVDGTGDGDTSPDWEIVDAHLVRLRAERAGTGSGRVYTITITCTDSAGNSTSQNVVVTVPKSNK